MQGVGSVGEDKHPRTACYNILSHKTIFALLHKAMNKNGNLAQRHLGWDPPPLVLGCLPDMHGGMDGTARE